MRYKTATETSAKETITTLTGRQKVQLSVEIALKIEKKATLDNKKLRKKSAKRTVNKTEK